MKMSFSVLVAVCSFALLAAVEKPVPPAPENTCLLAAGEDVPPVATGTVAVEGWGAPAVKDLSVSFGPGDKGRKSLWDFPIRCDLVAAGSLTLDVRVPCKELLSASLYLKSGSAGWYVGKMVLPDASVGRWTRLTLTPSTFTGVEGNPLGFPHVDGLRITFHRPRGGEAVRGIVKLANLSAPGVRGDAPLVVTSVSEETQRYATIAARAIRELGFPVAALPEGELTASALKGRPFVVLAYNPKLPKASAEALKAYLAAGGRVILASTGLSADVLAAAGVKRTGAWYQKDEKGTFRLGGILPAGSLKRLLPSGRVEQHSWQTDWLVPTGAGEVAATWADATGADGGKTALVKTPRGFVFGHVFLKEGVPLLQAAVRDLCPEAAAEYAAAGAARRAEVAAFAAAADRWAEVQEGKAGERRLMWCHSPLGLNKDGDWDASVRTLKELGYTDLIANLAWGAGADYPTKVGKTTPVGQKYGDLLGAAQSACRKYGVKLHVWLVCWPMSNKLEPAYIAELDRQGRLQYDASGARVSANNTAWLCPSSPENRDLLARLMLEFAERGADGVHFDYIRYPGESACYCAKCRERFEAQLGRPCAVWPKDVRAGGTCREAWLKFRCDNVTALVRRVREEVRARFPKVEVSAAVFRDPIGDRQSVAQDWAGWLKADLVDFVCPMDYTWSLSAFLEHIRYQKAEVGTDRVYPGIGLTSSARFPKDGGDALRFTEQVQAVRAEGFAGFTCFNYDERCVEAMKIARRGVLR